MGVQRLDHDFVTTTPFASATHAMFLFGFLGSLLALYILVRSPRKNPVFHSMLLALTVTDLVTTCAVVPAPLAALITNQTVTALGGDALCLYVSTALLYSSLVTQFVLCGLALERYLSIARPFHRSRLGRGCAVRTFLCVVYSFSAVVCALPLLGVGETREYEPGTWCYKNVHIPDAPEFPRNHSQEVFGKDKGKLVDWIFALFYSLLMLVLFFIMVVSNFVVLFVLFRLVKKRRRHLQPRSAHSSVVSHEDQNILNVVIAITVITLCCVMPLTFRGFISVITKSAVSTNNEDRKDVFIFNLYLLNSILDPWVYILARRSASVRLIQITCSRLCPCWFPLSREGENSKCSAARQTCVVIAAQQPQGPNEVQPMFGNTDTEEDTRYQATEKTLV
uniref:prostaglandin E2 receptor EP2 subtype-like n=1 Tax=Myxine glutinosa TaxID=7769 RepID=UPI00359027C4